jgi:hypothetical protein
VLRSTGSSGLCYSSPRQDTYKYNVSVSRNKIEYSSPVALLYLFSGITSQFLLSCALYIVIKLAALAQAYSPWAQVTAAAAHARRLNRTSERKN